MSEGYLIEHKLELKKTKLEIIIDLLELEKDGNKIKYNTTTARLKNKIIDKRLLQLKLERLLM